MYQYILIGPISPVADSIQLINNNNFSFIFFYVRTYTLRTHMLHNKYFIVGSRIRKNQQKEKKKKQ